MRVLVDVAEVLHGPVRNYIPPGAADLVVVRVVHQQHVVAGPRGRSQVPQVRERRGVVVVPVHEDQVAELGRLRRIEGGREGRERLLRVAERDVEMSNDNPIFRIRIQHRTMLPELLFS